MLHLIYYMNHNLKNKGFTLIETIVVITIIAVISAISFPVYNSVVLSSKTAKSILNLRQFGTGLASFASDNNSRYPIGENKDHSKVTNKGWAHAIAPFTDFGNDTDSAFISPN